MLRTLGLAAIVFGFALAPPLSTSQPTSAPLKVAASLLGVSPANAQSARGEIRRKVRRTVRRTERRIERRQDRLDALPSGCTLVLINGIDHWHCSGLYYRLIVENGANVYVIVTP